jgi:hypothetical protein
MKNKQITILEIGLAKKPKNYGSGIEIGLEDYPKDEPLKKAISNYLNKKKTNG